VTLVVGLVLMAFLFGTIPTGMWMGRLGGVDVLNQGSGNVGATNVARVMGKLPGIIVLIIDALKGWVPVLLLAPLAAGQLSVDGVIRLKIVMGAAAVAGHVWNPFLRLKGGKGVATALGVLIALDPRVAVASIVVFITGTASTRYVSVGSIASAFSVPFWMVLFSAPTGWVLGSVVIAIVVIARHRQNILRLLHGEENRLGVGKGGKG